MPPRAACVVWSLLLTLSSASAAAEPAVESIAVGFNGQHKTGHWTQVVVGLRAGDSPLEGSLSIAVPDGDGVMVEFSDDDRPIRLAPGASAQFARHVKFGRLAGRMIVSVRGPRGVALERTFAPSDRSDDSQSDAAIRFQRGLLSTQEFIVTIGESIGAEEAARLRRRKPSETIAATVVANARDLPAEWHGYEGVDTLVVTTANADSLGHWTPDRAAALQAWVRLGGRVVLCAAGQADQAIGREGPFAPLVPGRYERRVEQSELAAVEVYAGATQRLDDASQRRGLRVPMAQLTEVTGTVELSEGRGSAAAPALIRSAHGLGEVIFVALDLDQPPFAGWRDRTRLVDRLLWPEARGSDSLDAGGAEGRVSHLGFTDLAGQLRASLDQFPGVRRLEFSWVAALVVLYIALIGVGDYFLLRLLGGRMAWTWATFGAIVLAFCGLAWGLANASKGSRLLVNQAELMDVDWQTRQVRGALWAHVYSPASQTFDLSLTPALPRESLQGTPGSLLSWQGLPGDGLGGMNWQRPPMLRETYQIVATGDRPLRSALRGLPVQQWSTRSLAGVWWASLAPDAGLPEPELRSEFQRTLRGRVVNPLPVTLTDCHVYHDRWSYQLSRPLGPGETAQIGRDTPQSDLIWLLTQRRVDREHRDIATPWDRQSLDTSRILRLMMFFKMAGGEAYATLSHRYLDFTDLSALLEHDRAILVGRIAAPVSQIVRDGQPLTPDDEQQWTYCRIVFPVTQARESGR